MSGAARGGPEKKWGPTASDRAGKGRSQGKGGPEFPDSGRKGGSQPRRTSAPPEAGRKRGREGAPSLHARNKGGSIPERSRQSLGKAPKGWFIGETGLRPLWKGLAVLAGGWLVSLGVGLGLTAAMNSLYQVWGVNQDNILRAPIWIQLISGHWGEWVSIAQNLLLLPLAWVLCRWNRKEGLPWGRSGGKGFVLGAGFALALAALLLLADGLRMGRPLYKPLLSWEVLIPLAMYLCAALGVEALLRGALDGALAAWRPWARRTAGALAFAALTAPSWQSVTLVNQALMGLLLELGAERSGGFLAGAMARFGLYAVLYGLLGCQGASSVALYECYPAGHDWLSGGYQGPLSGGLALMMLAALTGWILYRRKRERWRMRE